MSSSQSKPASDDLRVGRVLGGKYELREQIGAGGGGTVFRALQQNTGQDVAVKVQRLSEGLDGLALHRQRTRFKREMEICARLHHPDIVRLIDFGEVNEDESFSVFEFVPGRTLREVLDSEGALKIGRALRLMGQLLVALAYAHGEGVIHRDLKPSNLMIVGEGTRERIKILDFGIGTLPLTSTGDLTRLTLTNEMVGTPAYAAPEQVRGELPTSKTDLYAWGLVLFETIVGRSAIRGSSLGEVLAQQLMPTPISLPDRLERHELGTLLRWVMQKNPARRAGSAEQLLVRLEALQVTELIDDNGYFVDSKPVTDLGNDATMTATGGARRVIEGERRQLTAVACRIQLRRRGDPVEFDLLDVYREDLLALCRATMHEFGGSDVGSLAGVTMFYFGVPTASDADARLAARATLELSARITRRNTALLAQRRIEASLHAGIHTGLLTLDPLADRAIQNGTVGTTAFELALLTPSSSESVIHVSDDFRELVVRHAEFADDGSHGLSTAWRASLIPTSKLIGESGSALYATNVAQLVGRESELDQLFAAWRERRPVLLRAEAGMGKSRLAHEFHERVEREGQRRIELRFVPESRGVAFGPLLELFERELDDREQMLELLRTLTIPVDQALVLLRDGLALPIAAELERLPYSPLKQRTMLEQLLVEYLGALLDQRDAYLLLEDLHWADPTSLQWLDRLLGTPSETRRFVLLTARPDFTPPFEHELTRVELDALTHEEVAELVGALPIASELPHELIELIVERADGIPLFAEELARAFVGRKSNEDAAVPATLRDLLMRRLDALGLAKDTAQIAAAIGREFEFELLAAISERDLGTLLGDLDQLISAGLIVRRPRIDHPSYLFRHALIRDAAYDSMTRERRSRIHRMIAEALLAAFPERTNARPELLALHYEKAERLDDAAKYLLEAGQRAVARSEHVEALTHVGHGIDLISTGAPESTVERRCQELRLRTVMIASSVATMGYAAEPVLVHSARARELAQEFGDPPELLPALYGLWVYHLARGVRGTTEDYAQQVLGFVERNPDRLAEISAHFAHGTTLLWSADFAGAEAAFGRVLERYDPAEHVELIRVFGDDHGLFAMVYLHWQHAMVGNVDMAKAFGERALELAEQYDDSLAQALVFVFGMLVSRELGDPEAALAFGERAIAVSARHKYPFWLANGTTGTGWARVMLGAGEEELPSMRQGLAFFDLIQQELPLSYWSTNLVEACLMLGRLDEAGAVIDRSLGLADVHLDVLYRPELERLAGKLALARGDHAEAESRFDRGIAVARATGAHLHGLRGAIAKAELLIARGEFGPAAALLNDACERVPRARETPFYAAARKLLAQCGS